MQYEVIWNGRGPLLPDREERWDTRFMTMPNYDLDETDVVGVKKSSRKYTVSGRYKGVFSRTNPTAVQYKPSGSKEGQ